MTARNADVKWTNDAKWCLCQWTWAKMKATNQGTKSNTFPIHASSDILSLMPSTFSHRSLCNRKWRNIRSALGKNVSNSNMLVLDISWCSRSPVSLKRLSLLTRSPHCVRYSRCQVTSTLFFHPGHENGRTFEWLKSKNTNLEWSLSKPFLPCGPCRVKHFPFSGRRGWCFLHLCCPFVGLFPSRVNLIK